jgi:pyruvate/2-oxoglutarate dehydrogenase complex dihydrolipoamide acyltransferase (E2) component
LKIISMGFALDADQAAIWRGPMKAGVMDQFIRRTQWEEFDVLVVDCPQGLDDGAVEIGGVGHQLVHQGPVVPVGEHQALVDPGDEGDGGDAAAEAPDQEGNGLQAVAHDVFGLGIAAGFLVEGLDPGHLPALLDGLDAVGEEDQPASGLEGREQGECEADPAGSEEVQVQGLAMEQPQETGIGGGLEPEDPDKAGDTGEVHAAAHAHEGQDEP